MKTTMAGYSGTRGRVVESVGPMSDILVLGPSLELGDVVELNSGGPPMIVVALVTPGRNVDLSPSSPSSPSSDVVAWWRAKDGVPQIIELDARCVRPTASPVPLC